MMEELCKVMLRNRVVLVSMVLNSEKLVLLCGRAVHVTSMSEQSVTRMLIIGRTTVMQSQIDIHRYSVANIIKL